MFTSQLFRFWEQMCPDVLKCFNIMIVSYFGNCSIWKRVTASDSGFRVTRQKNKRNFSNSSLTFVFISHSQAEKAWF